MKESLTRLNAVPIPARIVLSRSIFAAGVSVALFNGSLLWIGVSIIGGEWLFVRLAPILPRRQYSRFGIALLLLAWGYRPLSSEWNAVFTVILWAVATMGVIGWGIFSDLRLYRASRFYHRHLRAA